MGEGSSAGEIIAMNRGLCAALTMEWLKMMKEKAQNLKANEAYYVTIVAEYYSHILPWYSQGLKTDPEYYKKMADIWKQAGIKDLQLAYLEAGKKACAALKSKNNEATMDELINAQLEAQMPFLMSRP
jgi:hypothetical protein